MTFYFKKRGAAVSFMTAALLCACKTPLAGNETVAPRRVTLEEARNAKQADVLSTQARNTEIEMKTMPEARRAEIGRELIKVLPGSDTARIVIKLNDPEVNLGLVLVPDLSQHPLLEIATNDYGGKIIKSLPSLGSVVMGFSNVSDASQARDAMIATKLFLEKSILVEGVHGDAVITLAATPNDKDFLKQWHLNNTGKDYQTNSAGVTSGTAGVDIGAIAGWDKQTDASNIVVGMTDTGIQVTHPDLVANIWKNPGETGKDSLGRDKATNGVDDDGNGYVDDVNGWNCVGNNNNPNDDHGHGTGTAGVVGAAANNLIGNAGVAWNVKIAALKFLNASGFGNASDAAECLTYAVRMKMDIVNASWAGDATMRTDVEPLIKMAEDAGILVVAASGSFGLNIGTPGQETYPAAFGNSNVISVGSIGRSGAKSSFSNFSSKNVHVMAPGEAIWTTSKSSLQYLPQSGTSFAAPQVAGMAALMKAYFAGRDPEKTTPQKIRDNLIATSVPFAGLGASSQSGGYISLKNALAYDPPLTADPAAMDIPSAGGVVDSCPVAVAKFNPKFTARLMLPGGMCLAGMTPIKSYEQIIQNRQCCGIDLTPCVNGPLTLARWMIQDAFSRAAKPGEAEAIATSITSKTKTSAAVAAANYASDEIYLKNINTIHQKILKKTPPAASIPAWISQYRAGRGSEVFMTQLMATPEYFSLGGGRNDLWIRYIYQDILGRAPSVADVNAKVSSLNKGTLRYSVALALVQSVEYRSNFVITPAFQSLLRRKPTAADMTYWPNAMKAGKTPEFLRSLLASSLEYFNLKSVCPAPQ